MRFPAPPGLTLASLPLLLGSLSSWSLSFILCFESSANALNDISATQNIRARTFFIAVLSPLQEFFDELPATQARRAGTRLCLYGRRNHTETEPRRNIESLT